MKYLLYAENCSPLRDIVGARLVRRGYAVVSVTDGQELLENLKTGHFDLVLSALHLPIITGMQALQQIRADERLASLPVIVMTGDYSPLVRQAIEAEKGVYLNKGDVERNTESLYHAIELAITFAGVSPAG